MSGPPPGKIFIGEWINDSGLSVVFEEGDATGSGLIYATVVYATFYIDGQVVADEESGYRAEHLMCDESDPRDGGSFGHLLYISMEHDCFPCYFDCTNNACYMKLKYKQVGREYALTEPYITHQPKYEGPFFDSMLGPLDDFRKVQEWERDEASARRQMQHDIAYAKTRIEKKYEPIFERIRRGHV